MSDKSLPPIHFSDHAENVLVTGATGFIGQLLVRALLADGQQVTVLTCSPEKATSIFGRQVRCISSMRDLPASERIDVIINLAGARILGWRWSPTRKAELLASRVGLTKNLVEWIANAEQKPKLLLSGSAIGYYGVQKQGDDTALTEDSPPQPIFMSRLCREWEAAAQGASAYGVRVICMRFGLVLGRQGALPMMMLPIRLGLGGPLGSGRQWLTWIHVHDLLCGIAHLWKMHAQADSKPVENGAYNFTAPQAVPQREFSRIAAQVIGRPSFFPTPALAMRLMLGEQADLLLEGQRVAPTRLQAEGFAFSYPQLRSALESLY